MHNTGGVVEFAQSARRHRIGRGRVLAVLADPLVVLNVPDTGGRESRIVFLGDDATGRALEVMAVATERGLLVIHAMDLRRKWRRHYEAAWR